MCFREARRRRRWPACSLRTYCRRRLHTKRFFAVFWNKTHARVSSAKETDIYKCSVIENTSSRFASQCAAGVSAGLKKHPRCTDPQKNINQTLCIYEVIFSTTNPLQQAPVSIIVFTFRTHAGFSAFPFHVSKL